MSLAELEDIFERKNNNPQNLKAPKRNIFTLILSHHQQCNLCTLVRKKKLLTPGFKSEADAIIIQGMEKEWSKEKDVGLVFKRQNYIVANHSFLSHVRASQMLRV